MHGVVKDRTVVPATSFCFTLSRTMILFILILIILWCSNLSIPELLGRMNQASALLCNRYFSESCVYVDQKMWFVEVWLSLMATCVIPWNSEVAGCIRRVSIWSLYSQIPLSLYQNDVLWFNILQTLSWRNLLCYSCFISAVMPVYSLRFLSPVLSENHLDVNLNFYIDRLKCIL